MPSKYRMFSKMTWLEKDILRNEQSPGRNEISDYYYKNLLTIKLAQENGTISDEMYTYLLYWGKDAVEYGYYTSNIHGDFFSQNSDTRDNIDKRVLDFLIQSDCNLLKESDWFKMNFPHDFWFFISSYNINTSADKNEIKMIERYGNEMEIKIIELLKEICFNA